MMPASISRSSGFNYINTAAQVHHGTFYWHTRLPHRRSCHAIADSINCAEMPHFEHDMEVLMTTRHTNNGRASRRLPGGIIITTRIIKHWRKIINIDDTILAFYFQLPPGLHKNDHDTLKMLSKYAHETATPTTPMLCLHRYNVRDHTTRCMALYR